MYIPVNHLEKECHWCSNLFKPKTTHQNFCTRTCYKRHGKLYLGHSNGKNKKNYTGIPKIKKQYKKLSVCELCSFIPAHLCQLDIHHIDGNHTNNESSNLQTLCANCHRLITAKQLGWS
jgi:hypothetical protein